MWVGREYREDKKKIRHDSDEKTCKTRVGNAMHDIPKKNGSGLSIIDGPNNIYCTRLGLGLPIRFAVCLIFSAIFFKHVFKVLKASSYSCFT